MSLKQNESIMLIPIYSIEGLKTTSLEYVKHNGEESLKKELLAQYVRVYLTNQRQGNASAKTRAEVSGTTKKVYKQKGTGRARHGSMKAPIFKGGGVVGGPKPKEYSLSLTKKQKKAAFKAAFSYHLLNKSILGIEDLALSMKPKTKILQSFLTKTKLINEKILFIVPSNESKGFFQSTKNIPQVVCKHIGLVNAFDLLNAEKVVLTPNTFQTLLTYYES